jgi:hypothetical protein
MNELHKKDGYGEEAKPEGGLQASLCSNEAPSCSSPLGFINNNLVTEDDELDYLAEVLVQAFLEQRKKYAIAKSKESGDLLPSVDKGAS